MNGDFWHCWLINCDSKILVVWFLAVCNLRHLTVLTFLDVKRKVFTFLISKIISLEPQGNLHMWNRWLWLRISIRTCIIISNIFKLENSKHLKTINWNGVYINVIKITTNQPKVLYTEILAKIGGYNQKLRDMHGRSSIYTAERG